MLEPLLCNCVNRSLLSDNFLLWHIFLRPIKKTIWLYFFNFWSCWPMCSFGLVVSRSIDSARFWAPINFTPDFFSKGRRCKQEQDQRGACTQVFLSKYRTWLLFGHLAPNMVEWQIWCSIEKMIVAAEIYFWTSRIVTATFWKLLLLLSLMIMYGTPRHVKMRMICKKRNEWQVW